jgi:hypothetical protein
MHRPCVSALVVVGCAIGAGGCGGTSEPAEPVEPVEPTVLEIPVQPVSEQALFGIAYRETSPPEPGLIVTYPPPAAFALGERYPKRFLALLQRALSTNASPLAGTFTFTGVTTSSAAVEVAIEPDGRLQIDLRELGVGEIVVSGEYTAAAGDADMTAGQVLPVKWRIPVAVISAARPRLTLPIQCQEATVPRVTVSSLSTLAARIEHYVLNASPEAQVPVTVRALRGGKLALDEGRPPGLGALRFPSSPDLVEVTPEGGEPRTVEVLAPASLTRSEVTFQISTGHAGTLTVTDGQTLGANGWRGDQLFAGIGTTYKGDAPLCSDPDRHLFSLESLTPDTCPVRPLMGDPGEYYLDHGKPLPHSIRILKDGRCAARVRAPGFAGGSGFTSGISVTLVNVKQLTDNP